MRNSNYTIPEKKMKTMKKVDKIFVREIRRHHSIKGPHLYFACKEKRETMKKADKIGAREISRRYKISLDYAYHIWKKRLNNEMRNSNYTIPERKRKP